MAKAPLLFRTGFLRGVKASYEPSAVPPDALWEARNFRIEALGRLVLRSGTVAFSTSLGNIPAQGAVSAFGDILLAWNRGLYRIDQSGSPTTIREDYLGATAQDRVTFLRWSRDGAEIVYILAGNGLFGTDGVGSSLVVPTQPQTGGPENLLLDPDTGEQDVNSGPARCRVGIIREAVGQRMVLARDPASPNTLYFSDPFDPGYFAANETAHLPDDGGQIVALDEYYGAILIIRDRDVWAFFGSSPSDPDAILVRQDGSIGCVDGRSVAQVPDVGIVFTGPDNIYAITGVTAVEDQVKATPIGDDVLPHYLQAVATGTPAVATYHDGSYILCFPEIAFEERVFRFTRRNGVGWLIDTGPRVASYVVHNGVLYGAARDAGRLFRFDPDATTDEGRQITGYAAFRREFMQPGPGRLKRVLLYVVANETLQDLEVSVVLDSDVVSAREFRVQAPAASDFIIGKSTIGTGQIGRADPVQVYEASFRPSLKGHFVQLRIACTQPGQKASILGYALDYGVRGRVHGTRV